MNENDFMRLIKLYRSDIFRLAFFYMRNYDDAEDITQETYLKLYQCKKNFESDEHAKAWLNRVTINGCKNILKSAHNRLSVASIIVYLYYTTLSNFWVHFKRTTGF